MLFLLSCAFLFFMIHLFVRLSAFFIAYENQVKEGQVEDFVDVMIQCPTCNIYVLKRQAIAYNKKLFCCPEHACIC